MFNIFELIPKTIDKNLRDLIIILITVQLILLVIYITYMTYEFIRIKMNKNNENSNDIQKGEGSQKNSEMNENHIKKE